MPEFHDVEQNTPEWFILRAGIPTASMAKSLVTSTGLPSKSMQDYIFTLAADMHAGKPLDQWEGNQYTEMGIEREADARIAYEQEKGVWVEDVGFVTHNRYGCSPDGLVGDDGLIEIKCLKASNHIKMMVKKSVTSYIAQVQMQLLVTGRSWCDLTFYYPELPLVVIRLKKDIKLQDALTEQLYKCIKARDVILEGMKARCE